MTESNESDEKEKEDKSGKGEKEFPDDDLPATISRNGIEGGKEEGHISERIHHKKEEQCGRKDGYGMS